MNLETAKLLVRGNPFNYPEVKDWPTGAHRVMTLKDGSVYYVTYYQAPILCEFKKNSLFNIHDWELVLQHRNSKH